MKKIMSFENNLVSSSELSKKYRMSLKEINVSFECLELLELGKKSGKQASNNKSVIFLIKLTQKKF